MISAKGSAVDLRTEIIQKKKKKIAFVIQRKLCLFQKIITRAKMRLKYTAVKRTQHKGNEILRSDWLLTKEKNFKQCIC